MHTHIHRVQGVNCCLSYKMKITLISLFIRYIYENYMKITLNILNLFKDIAIGFNHGLQMSTEFPGSLSNRLLAEIGKSYHYP